MLSKTLLLAGTIALASALPAPAPSPAESETVKVEASGAITADLITKIAPSTASCSGAAFPDECADAATAAKSISASFEKYKITEPGTQAALISLMLYESGNFVYNKNHYPGVPGQGTKNMQSPAFNLLYAKSLFPDKAAAAEAQGPEAVLALVSGNDETFGSAAWFLTSQCTPAIAEGLASATSAGWSAYLTQCVGTTDTPDRDTIWTAAKGALGV